MIKVPVQTGEIRVNQALPWPIYDAAGNLLLRKGYVIESESQLATMFKRGIYRVETTTPNESAQLRVSARIYMPERGNQRDEETGNPITRFSSFLPRLDNIFSAIMASNKEVKKWVLTLARDIQKLCNEDTDAALGAVHLYQEQNYTLYHPVHVAILCEFVALRAGYAQHDREVILAAALTANIAIVELQETLQQQTGALTDEQKQLLHIHPESGTALLRAAGIEDATWLRYILQHHERVDGTGYPRGLKGNAIAREAMMIALADSYAAMVSSRAYRGALPAKEVLRDFFVSRGQQFDEQLSLFFVKELGVYPPGLFVTLANGEKGVVIQRTENSTQPIVGSYKNARGELYLKPMRRNTADPTYSITTVVPREITGMVQPHLLWGK